MKGEQVGYGGEVMGKEDGSMGFRSHRHRKGIVAGVLTTGHGKCGYDTPCQHSQAA